jgi:hypothetical protein
VIGLIGKKPDIAKFIINMGNGNSVSKYFKIPAPIFIEDILKSRVTLSFFVKPGIICTRTIQMKHFHTDGENIYVPKNIYNKFLTLEMRRNEAME